MSPTLGWKSPGRPPPCDGVLQNRARSASPLPSWAALPWVSTFRSPKTPWKMRAMMFELMNDLHRAGIHPEPCGSPTEGLQAGKVTPVDAPWKEYKNGDDLRSPGTLGVCMPNGSLACALCRGLGSLEERERNPANACPK